MKLWEAMLEGAKRGPQLFNKQTDGNGGTCALGAIELISGDGCGYTEEHTHQLKEPSSCPLGPCGSFTKGQEKKEFAPENVAQVIMHLNNDHRWSRQRIAEWLANPELKFKESNVEVQNKREAII